MNPRRAVKIKKELFQCAKGSVTTQVVAHDLAQGSSARWAWEVRDQVGWGQAAWGHARGQGTPGALPLACACSAGGLTGLLPLASRLLPVCVRPPACLQVGETKTTVHLAGLAPFFKHYQVRLCGRVQRGVAACRTQHR